MTKGVKVKSIADEFKDEIINQINNFKTVKEISENLKISVTTIRDFLKKEQIIVKDKFQKEKDEVLKLHHEGKAASEIEEITGRNLTTVKRWIKDAGFVHNTKVMKAKDAEVIESIKKLVIGGKTSKEIATELKLSQTTVRKYTNLVGLETNSTKIKPIKNNIILSNIQSEIIYGSLLGDMCLTDGWTNARLIISQGGNQEEYFDYKCSFFNGLLGKVSKEPRYDKRTDKWYNKYAVKFLANPIYTELKKELYPNGVKTVTKEWLSKITPRALAFWFMDDGSKEGVLATNSFSLSEIELIQTWFFEKYNIKVSIQKAALSKTGVQQYIIYLLAETRLLFEELIFPYMIPSMYYKLKKLDPNLVNSGKLLRDSNTNLQ